MSVFGIDPHEFLICAWGRFACRVLRHHNLTCRGRADHPKGKRP